MGNRSILALAGAAALFLTACGSGSGTTNSNQANKPANAGNSAATKPAASEYYSSVHALRGARMPDDAKLTEQKREFAHVLHVNLRRYDGITSMNWDEKFKDPSTLKLVDDESVLVVTLASAEGKKLEKGEYAATEAADAADTAPKDSGFAIMTLVTKDGAKRVKGKLKVTDTEKMIMFSYSEKPAAPKLDALSYGAPFKN